MHIRIRLLLMKEIDRRNQERIDAYITGQERPPRRRKKKPMRNRRRPGKKP